MSFLTGKTKVMDTTPQDVRGTRKKIGEYVDGPGGLERSRVGGGGPEEDAFIQQILAPYQAMFAAQRAQTLGQAKESAGNLTGSGYNNILGSSAAQSLAGEQLQLGNMRYGMQQQNASNFLNLLNSFQGAGSPGQVVQQPGLLDYALQAGQTAAGIWGGRRQGSNSAPPWEGMVLGPRQPPGLPTSQPGYNPYGQRPVMPFPGAR